jgi:hypothetical protein
MRKFVVKFFLHASIPLIILGYLIVLGFMDNLHITNIQHENVLIGEPYNESYFKWYKWQRNIDNIDLLAIGSSRVLQFKSDFFIDSFFNLGYLVATPKQTLQLIQEKQIKNKKIVISLDQWSFNSEWSSGKTDFIAPSEPSFWRSCICSERVMDILTFKITLFKRTSQSQILKIGAGANVSLDGITSDGSYYYGKKYHGVLTNNEELIGQDYHFLNTIDRISKGNRRFQYGKECDESAIEDVEKLIKYNFENGNSVIYFFPPFPPKVQKFLKSDKYSYIQDASRKIKQISKMYNVVFHDYTFFESSDDMYIDGFHGGTELYYQLANSMGLNTRDCLFKNQFETIADSMLFKERLEFFRQ